MFQKSIISLSTIKLVPIRNIIAIKIQRVNTLSKMIVNNSQNINVAINQSGPLDGKLPFNTSHLHADKVVKIKSSCDMIIEHINPINAKGNTIHTLFLTVRSLTFEAIDDLLYEDIHF